MSHLVKVAIGFFLILLVFATVIWNQAHEANAYFRNFHLQLQGYVTGKAMDSHKGGILYLDVTNSSLRDYDPRDTLLHWYCIIHKDKAEVLERGIGEIEAGDSVSIDTDRNTFQVFRGRRKVLIEKVSSPTFIPVVESIHDKHKLPSRQF